MKSEDDVVARLRESVSRISPPSGRIEGVIARTSHRRKVRKLSALLVGAVVLGAVAAPLVLLLPLGGDRPTGHGPAAASGTFIDVGGVGVSVPDSWYGRVYYVSGYTRPVIQIATFTLPDTTDIAAASARGLIGSRDVLMALVEYSAVCPCPGFDTVPLPLTIASADFSTPFDVWHQMPPQATDVPETHALARRTFESSGRFFDLWVEFGQRPPSPALVDKVNSILATLTIGTYSSPTQPDGLCNQWSPPKDPDCPETIWLYSVLATAGFEVINDPNESTLIGKVGADRFFIWTRQAEGSLADRGLPVFSTISDVTLYGDSSQVVWRAQGIDVWVAPGPFDGDSIPGIEALNVLVNTTTRTPEPGS